MELNIKNNLMVCSSTHNLNWLIGFHNYVRGLLKEQLKELETCKKQDAEKTLPRDALFQGPKSKVQSWEKGEEAQTLRSVG
jgi:hypothetical protein